MADKSNIFISYAREDHKVAKRLYDDLKKAGLTPWMDKENILAGQNWKESISKAIKNSRYFIALLSSKSLTKKGFVQKELKTALDIFDEFPSGNIFFIPVRLDECAPSDERLENIQWVDLYPSYEDGLTQILRSVKSDEIPQEVSGPESTAPVIGVPKTSQAKKKYLTISFMLIPVIVLLTVGYFPWNNRQSGKSFQIDGTVSFLNQGELGEPVGDVKIELPMLSGLNTVTDRYGEFKILISDSEIEGKRELLFRLTIGETSYFLTPSVSKLKKMRIGISKTNMIDGKSWSEPETGMEFVRVPGGMYRMGCDDSTNHCPQYEKPEHEVFLNSFWIGRKRVTSGQWEKVMKNGKHEKYISSAYFSETEQARDLSVTNVSWHETNEFITGLENMTKRKFRLPREAEWEYVCRKEYGADVSDPDNMYEWCEDVYSPVAYEKHGICNPLYVGSGSGRVLRGGDSGNDKECPLRKGCPPDTKSKDIGFRIAMPEPEVLLLEEFN